MSGRVSLVGAGPGDPGLLTRRGAEVLARAEVVIHDRLASPEVVALAPPEAERIYVGKDPNASSTPQERIEALLVEHARAGKRVVRLKGGDPFVFGRGGEEALTLREAGIPFEVVPGVTAGIAAPAYAGIPVTHRAVAVGCAFFTGHEDPTKAENQLNLESLARPGTTGIFYMGRKNLPRLAGRLLELGRDPSTPVALVEWGTHPHQRTVTGTLGDIVEVADAAAIRPPCITLVGEVVELREQLSWFEGRPLFGRCVAVTRARAQASGLAADLKDLGASVLEAPAIRVADPEDPAALQAAAADPSGYDWVLFTSTNSVARFMDAVEAAGGDARRLAGAQLVAIGGGTEAALRGRGLRADLVPESSQSEGVLAALEGKVEAGARVLLPRAAVAREVLPETLREWGAQVDVVEAYRTECVPPDELAVQAFAEQKVDMVTFTSSSTVKNFHETLGRHHPRGYKVAAIGPITARSAEALGYPVDVVADEASVEGLVQAVREALAP